MILTKLNYQQLQDALRFKCHHGHNGLSHPTCYEKEKNIKEKIGFIDLEFFGLNANFGIVLTWVIKPENSDKVLFDVITSKDKNDKRIVASCIKAMHGFDRLVGHYASNGRCDMPYLRTRALKHGLEFPKHGEIYFSDTYPMAKNYLRLHSNRQDCISEALRGTTIKTRMSPDTWINAVIGFKKESLKYILDHNIKDTYECEENFHALLPFCKLSKTSI